MKYYYIFGIALLVSIANIPNVFAYAVTDEEAQKMIEGWLAPVFCEKGSQAKLGYAPTESQINFCVEKLLESVNHNQSNTEN